MWLQGLQLAFKAGSHIFKQRQQEKMLMADARRLHAEKMAKGEITMEKIIRSDQQNSLKDEFVLLLVSAPVMLLIWSVFSEDPLIKEKIDLFFDYFGNMPMWFQVLFISVVGAVYGIKGADIIKRK